MEIRDMNEERRSIEDISRELIIRCSNNDVDMFRQTLSGEHDDYEYELTVTKIDRNRSVPRYRHILRNVADRYYD